MCLFVNIEESYMQAKIIDKCLNMAGIFWGIIFVLQLLLSGVPMWFVLLPYLLLEGQPSYVIGRCQKDLILT